MLWSAGYDIELLAHKEVQGKIYFLGLEPFVGYHPVCILSITDKMISLISDHITAT